MPRIRPITLDGVTEKIAPFSYDETEEYVKKSAELVAREPKLTNDDWMNRILDTVCFALNKANPEAKWDPNKLTATHDQQFIFKLHQEFMEMSSLRTTAVGEAPATSTGR